MIYTDGVHLVTDGPHQELHDFAARIGLRREWYQDHERHPHYDMTVNWRFRRAIACGARRVSSRDLIRIVRFARSPDSA